MSSVPIAQPPLEGQRERDWGVGEAAVCLAIAFGASIIGSSVLLLLAGRTFLVRHELAFAMLAYQFLVVGVALSVAFLRGTRGAGPAALGFRLSGWDTILGAALAGVTAVLLGTIAITGIFHALFPHYGLKGNASQVLAGISRHTPLGVRVLAVLWAAVEAPLAEETLFRGILYQGLRSFLDRYVPFGWAVATAALSSGLIFGLLHLAPQTLPLLAFMGIVLALVFQYGRSIYASLLVHGVMNALATVVLLHSS